MWQVLSHLFRHNTEQFLLKQHTSLQVLQLIKLEFNTHSEIFVIVLQTVLYAIHQQKNDVPVQKLESKLSPIILLIIVTSEKRYKSFISLD